MKNRFLLLHLFLALLIFAGKKQAQEVELLGLPGPAAQMKIHPNDPNYLYSSDPHNGSFFRTTDGGITNEWFDLGNFGYIIGSIACDYDNPDIFYAGPGQVFKTIDGGKSWVEIFRQEDNQSWNYDFEISPINPNILFSITNEHELWKSYNGGESWFQLATFDEGITQIGLSHQDTSLIYVATINHLRRSTNGGESWELTMVISQTHWLRVFKMEVNPFDDQQMDYIIEGEYNGDDVYRSTDGGYTVRKLFSGEPLVHITDFATDFTDTSTVYVTFKGSLFKTTDAGQTWENLNNNFPFDDIEAGQIEISLTEPNILYLSTRMGIYKTTNSGKDWFVTNSAYTNIFNLFVSQEQKGTFLVGARTGRIMKTTNYGETWYRPIIEPDEFIPWRTPYKFFSMNPFDESQGFMGTGANLYITTDLGEIWNSTWQFEGDGVVKYHPYEKDVIYTAAYMSTYRSLDNGNSWSSIQGVGIDISSIVSNKIDTDKMFAIAYDGIRRSSDLGMSWELSLSHFGYDSLYKFMDLAMSPDDSETAYCTAELYWSNDYERHLFKTTNFGEDWFTIDSSLAEIDPNLNIQSIVIDEENPKRMFVGLRYWGIPYSESGSSGGLYLTEDDGKSWTKLYDGTVNLIRLDYNEPRYVYFGTKFGLMRMRDTLVTEIVDDTGNIPVNFSLSQNYPNPFSKGSGGNPTTTIKYEIPETGFVTLKIYDVLGREVATLVNAKREAGRYEAEFNAKGLSSGIYIYRIQAGNFTESKKMILLK